MEIAISLFVIAVCIGMTVALLVGAYALWVDIRLTRRINDWAFKPIEEPEQEQEQENGSEDYSDFVM